MSKTTQNETLEIGTNIVRYKIVMISKHILEERGRTFKLLSPPRKIPRCGVDPATSPDNFVLYIILFKHYISNNTFSVQLAQFLKYFL